MKIISIMIGILMPILLYLLPINITGFIFVFLIIIVTLNSDLKRGVIMAVWASLITASYFLIFQEPNNCVLLVQITSFIVIPVIIGKSKERHDATLKSIGNGLIITNSEGKIILLNKEGETITGWKEREVLKAIYVMSLIYIVIRKRLISKQLLTKYFKKGKK